jgi:4-amino-4-deoxy-L-arabinose transferase-like glycosyltransferase
MGVSSDSWYHLRVSQAYENTLTVPENTPETYKWRDLEHQPYLYFWINGRLLNLNEITFNFNGVIVLRVINIIYSLFTLYGTYLLSKEFFKKNWLRLLPVFLLSNTLMFVFLSSSINYDNMANMFSVFSILFFVRALKDKGNWKKIFLMLIFIFLGGLTKYTFLPLAFILIVLMGYFVIKNWKVYKENFKGKILYLLLPILVLVIMNIGVYGVNLIRFHSLTPKCLDVLTYDQCLENGVFYRDNVTIPAQEVDLFKMVLSGERLDPIRYAGVWIFEMAIRIFGIMGDKSLFAKTIIIPFYLLFFLISFIVGILNWRNFSKEIKYLSIVTLFYLLVLLFVQNYDMYLKRSYPTLALQGRYMFPVISSVYVLFVFFLNRIKNKRLRAVIFVSLIVLFIIGCLPFFIRNVDSSWFGSIDY